MGEFLFKAECETQLCLESGDGFYQIQRKTADGSYVPFTLNGETLQVNGRSNRCVLIPFKGDYRITWKEPTNCASSTAPVFKITECCDPLEDRGIQSSWQ
jgi:hypothetical protein